VTQLHESRLNVFGRIHVEIAQAIFGSDISRRSRAAAAYHCRAQSPADLPPGAPPAFGAGPAVGPEVSRASFAEARSRASGVADTERAVAAGSWRKTMAALYERRTGRASGIGRRARTRVALGPGMPGLNVAKSKPVSPQPDRPGPLAANDPDIAFASLSQLSRWIEQRKLTSERLTHIYLQRMEQFDDKLHCVITLTRELALAQAKRPTRKSRPESTADHCTRPWGAKDLLDTAGIPTTYGAEPYRDRVPTADAAVVKRLREAGAVLVAKLSLGRSRAERHLVRWANDESVAAGGRIVRLERRPGCRHRGGPSRLRDRAARRAAALSAPACVAGLPVSVPPTAACRAPAP